MMMMYFLSYNLMLNSGKKNRALPDKKIKYSNSRVVQKKILNEKKTHSASVVYITRTLLFDMMMMSVVYYSNTPK
jgi:hypothetical protein